MAMAFSVKRQAGVSFLAAGTDRLLRLCEAAGMQHRSSEILAIFERLLDPWGAETIGNVPHWPSEVGDDHTPYEFSVAFGTATELRLLVEPLGSPPSLVLNRDRALAVIDDL